MTDDCSTDSDTETTPAPETSWVIMACDVADKKFVVLGFNLDGREAALTEGHARALEYFGKEVAVNAFDLRNFVTSGDLEEWVYECGLVKSEVKEIFQHLVTKFRGRMNPL